MERVVTAFTKRPHLARILLVLVGLVAAACDNSGGRPGY
jgi:hypothetical protein